MVRKCLEGSQGCLAEDRPSAGGTERNLRKPINYLTTGGRLFDVEDGSDVTFCGIPRWGLSGDLSQSAFAIPLETSQIEKQVEHRNAQASVFDARFGRVFFNRVRWRKRFRKQSGSGSATETVLEELHLAAVSMHNPMHFLKPA
jgi:hypothetical protein